MSSTDWEPTPQDEELGGPPTGRGARGSVGTGPWPQTKWAWRDAARPPPGPGRGACLSDPPLARLTLGAPWELPHRVGRRAGTRGPARPDTGPARARAPPRGAVRQSPTHRGGQPYFPLLLRLFPLLRGGDRAPRAWVRFRGLPGPLRAKLLWGSSRLSLKENHTLGCERRGGGRGGETHGAPTTLGSSHTSAGLPRGTYCAPAPTEPTRTTTGRPAGAGPRRGARTHSDSRRLCSFSSSRCFSL